MTGNPAPAPGPRDAAARDAAAGFEVGEDFRGFSQRDDIFCRSFWDPEVRSDRSDLFYETYRTPQITWRKVDGFTRRDYSLRNASWHVTDIFAELHETVAARGSAASPGGSFAAPAAAPPDRPPAPWEDRGGDRREGFLDPYTVLRDGPGEPQPVSSPEAAAREVKRAALTLGANLVGIAGNDPRWLYTHAYSRDSESEKPQELPEGLDNVVVVAHAMDRGLLRTAPSALSGAATGAAYSRDTVMLLALAQYIINLGYRAVASMNDSGLAIPLAIQAGLGEYGRHGLLITPEFGPRVRLGKVFTDMPLAHDRPLRFGVREFCETCRACTQSCPPRAIDGGPPSTVVHNRSNIRGVRKWTTDAEKCFRFWSNQNTDCAICVRVCPYNRDYAQWPSRAWRWLAGTRLRRLALWLDARGDRAKRMAPRRWWEGGAAGG